MPVRCDRDGCPITIERWTELHGDLQYCHVARSTVMDAADPNIVLDVSTVWLGLDHSWMSGPPLIFETMVFRGDDVELCDRYAIERQAQEGHVAMVALVASGMRDPVVMDAPHPTSA